MTYNVFSWTLNPTQSIDADLVANWSRRETDSTTSNLGRDTDIENLYFTRIVHIGCSMNTVQRPREKRFEERDVDNRAGSAAVAVGSNGSFL